MLYKNTKVKVRSLDGDIDYFNIVAGVLQGDTLAPYLFIIRRDYVLRTSIEIYIYIYTRKLFVTGLHKYVYNFNEEGIRDFDYHFIAIFVISRIWMIKNGVKLLIGLGSLLKNTSL